MTAFYGEYNQVLDGKNRMRLPAKFRSRLGKDYYILNGSSGSLMVMDGERFNALSAKFEQIPLSDLQARRAITKIMASVVEPEEDTQGRFVLPQKAIKYAGIQKNIMVVGSLDHIEIWSEERYNELGLGEGNDYDVMLENLKNYNI